jgi:hypothetical protein
MYCCTSWIRLLSKTAHIPKLVDSPVRILVYGSSFYFQVLLKSFNSVCSFMERNFRTHTNTLRFSSSRCTFSSLASWLVFLIPVWKGLVRGSKGSFLSRNYLGLSPTKARRDCLGSACVSIPSERRAMSLFSKQSFVNIFCSQSPVSLFIQNFRESISFSSLPKGQVPLLTKKCSFPIHSESSLIYRVHYTKCQGLWLWFSTNDVCPQRG